MALRERHPHTPDVVIRHGWRDRPIGGVDRCEGCFGWGTKSVTVGDDCVIVHRTCPTCHGRGRR